MAKNFEQCVEHFEQKGFYRTADMVVLHHLRKDFSDLEVTRDRFFILPVGADFIHVAVVEHEWNKTETAVLVKYACAGDDLLYGLRIKFNSGGSKDNENDFKEIDELLEARLLRNHPRFVRKRFRHGRTQAKVRAALRMLVEKWRLFTSSFKVREP